MFVVRRWCGGGVAGEKGGRGPKVAWGYLPGKHIFAPPQEKNKARHCNKLVILLLMRVSKRAKHHIYKIFWG